MHRKKKERVDGTSQCKSQRVLQASFALNVLESLSLPSYFFVRFLVCVLDFSVFGNTLIKIH